MSAAQRLYELQTLDLRIATDAGKLEAERSRMEEPQSIRDARANLEAKQNELASGRKDLRSVELEIESVSQKKKAVHAKLYGGTVSVPRELAALEAEEATLAHSLAQLEDRALDLMAESEAVEQAISVANKALAQEQARWQREGSEATSHIAQLEAELEKLKAERQALAEEIGPKNVALYERLRPRKGNRPVAVVEKNSCQGCGVALPSREVQQARNADPPQVCDNCGRILYVR